ncbi:MAG: hypothetical protein KAX51_07430 [Chromatiaceae bacterium]|nr:hypothetical protein [Chromatiaceae bacterium]MBP8289617.1 hypothetical protein [Chromatiaceae bacterium]
MNVGRHDLAGAAAHLAGQAFVRYRRQGGTRTAPLPDFYIDADAWVSGFTLITRDVQRYRRCSFVMVKDKRWEWIEEKLN